MHAIPVLGVSLLLIACEQDTPTGAGQRVAVEAHHGQAQVIPRNLDLEVVTLSSGQLTDSPVKGVTVPCPEGKFATGGGHRLMVVVLSDLTKVHFSRSGPKAIVSDRAGLQKPVDWTVVAEAEGAVGGWGFDAYVICASL